MYKELIALDMSSRVWIYQADREVTYDEIDVIRPQLFDFVDTWTAHNDNLFAYANIFHLRFIGIFVDETNAGASGCSIDKSTHFVDSLGRKTGVNFFDRMTFAYLKDDDVLVIAAKDMKEAYRRGMITNDTLFFDNLVKTKEEFLKLWIKPLSDSWHKKFV